LSSLGEKEFLGVLLLTVGSGNRKEEDTRRILPLDCWGRG
jgi:hypothetical protein